MIKDLISIFRFVQLLDEHESFNLFKYKAKVKLENEVKLDFEFYSGFKNYLLNNGDKWTFEIEELGYQIDEDHFEDLEFDVEDIEDFCTIELTIFKNGSPKVIYDENVFHKFLAGASLQKVLGVLNENTRPILLFNDIFRGKTSSTLIGYNEVNAINGSKEISLQCYFYNYSDFKFYPSDFRLVGEENIIATYFKKIYFVFILIYLFDVSEIKDDNIILKIIGGKTINYALDFRNLDLSSFEQYDLIYTWVYSEKDKIEEKIGIARNILTLYLKAEDINIDEQVYYSILSANQLYIKENVSKFIDTRNNIFEQLDAINGDINSSLDSFANNFSKSVLLFVTFYISIFILKVFEKTNITSVLSKEETLTGIGLLILYAIYLFFSMIVLNLEKNRIYKKYETLKSRFVNILGNEQVKYILENDKEFGVSKLFFKKRRVAIVILWLVTLLILLVILFSTSDYINFKYIWEDNSSSMHNKVNLIEHRERFGESIYPSRMR